MTKATIGWPLSFLCPHPARASSKSAGFFHGEYPVAQAAKFDASELVTSPMVNTSLLIPRILLAEIDRAALRDDPCSPSRSSWMRRALIDRLKREAA